VFSLLPHAHPDVGVDNIARARPPAAIPDNDLCTALFCGFARIINDLPGRSYPRGSRPPDLSKNAARMKERIEHVISIADIGNGNPLERPALLLDSKHVAEGLTRMREVAETMMTGIVA